MEFELGHHQFIMENNKSKDRSTLPLKKLASRAAVKEHSKTNGIEPWSLRKVELCELSVTPSRSPREINSPTIEKIAKPASNKDSPRFKRGPNPNPRMKSNGIETSSLRKAELCESSISTLSQSPREFNSPTIKKIAKTTSNKNYLGFKPGPNLNPPFAENTHCQELFAFAMKYGLPAPEFFNFSQFNPTNSKTSYMCKVKIENQTFSTFFEDCYLNVVHEEAARVALKELRKQFDARDFGATFGTATEKEQIISRLTNIVKEHPTGLRKETVESRFMEVFKEKLPANWIDIIKSLSLMSVEDLVGGVVVYPAPKIPQKHEDFSSNNAQRSNTVPFSKSSACNIPHREVKSSPSLNKSNLSLNYTHCNKLPPLTLPESNRRWNVSVTTCLSPNCVYLRIVGKEYQENYNKLTQILMEGYEARKTELSLLPVEMVVREGGHYVAHLWASKWCRVKVLSAIAGGCEFRVELIDHGETTTVLKKFLFPLTDELVNLPAQAVRCCLTGLEKFHENEYATHAVCNELEYHSRDGGLVARVDSRDPQLMLTFFLCSPDKDVDLNLALRAKIESTLEEPPLLLRSNVYVTKVEEDGRAHVQIISENWKMLMSLMADVQRSMVLHEEKYRLKSLLNLIGRKVVLAKYKRDQLWHRAIVVSLVDDNKVASVQFIDYGHVEMVPIEHLAELRHFSNVLTAIPPQAVQVQLIKPTKELFTPSIIKLILDLESREKTVPRLSTMVVIRKNPIPDVELFWRSHCNQLIRLNDIIGSFYPNYRNKTFKDVTLDVATYMHHQKQTSRLLKGLCKVFASVPPFELPSINSKMSLHVSIFVNPGHFIVQPLNHRNDFQKMTKDMKIYYSLEKPLVDVQTIQVGNVFAIEVEEEWRRGMVIRVSEDVGEVAFNCLDYGDVVSVYFKNIYPLTPHFQSLPAQAIKAELAGIAPVHNDWNSRDYYRFHELLNRREFDGVIVEASEGVVSLLLYDTSVSPMVNVNAVLVEERRAIDVISLVAPKKT